MASDEHPPKFLDDPRRQDQYNINSKIMLTAIVCLFFVVVVVVALHIYARCVLKRQARRRAAMRQLGIGITAAGVHSSEPARTGLEPSVIASLPIFVYKRVDEFNDAIECSVCLSPLEEEEMARILPNCKHTFHAQCIDIWLNAHSTCPICRTEAEPRAHLDQSVGLNAVVIPPTTATAPPLDSSMNFTFPCLEGTSDDVTQSSKVGGSSSRLSSFRRMLSREKSERRVQPCETADIGVSDLERQ